MALLVVLVAAVVVVVLVVRAAASPNGAGRSRAPRSARPPRGQAQPRRAVGPDDDPDFLRELQRRTRRDDSAA
jgi:hypothetical protein